ncbi:hypothetical protein LPJ66_000304 [Kickxella alabastrina]|uniref:Uncharacterized protein n=1 Tax=Kickxella alabastrina TaxID=61397 RepID=A0ACC1IWI9_9FUNG|nr:hypothetical protein LPJ66_000304 [Kickxella alabastrina]
MEVDLSPEEYFRQQAAALLHSVEDPLDDNNSSKESWSEIDDNSGAEDNAAVLKRKRILRHGRMRLSEINERFSASKKKLAEARKHQLDLEMQQLKDGTHPQYKEFIEQVDARWSDRLAKIELEMESRRALAKVKLDSSRTSAKNTFIASKGEVRRAMVYRRKKQMWALTDNLRNLERIREAITNVACPLSNQAGIKIPERGTKASNESDHLLSMPDTHLARIDEDADVSAVCGIPALLNYAETEMSAPEDSAAAGIPTHNAAAAITEATDTRVPRSQVGYAHDDMGAAYGYQGVGAGHNVADETVLIGGTVATYELAESARDYGRAYAGHQAIPDARTAGYNAQGSRHGSRHGSVAAPVAAAVVASATASALTSTSVGAQPYATRNQAYYGDSAYQASYYDSSDYKAPNPRAPTMQHSPSVTATGTGVEKYAYGSKRHARINGAVEEYQTPGYYGSNGTTTAPVAVSAQNGSVATKHKYPAEFDEVPGKRQRTVHTSSTWPASQYYQQQQYQHQDDRSWNEPVSATDKSGNPMVDSGATMHSYGYGRQAEYHQKYSGIDADVASGSAYQAQYSHPPPPPLSGDQAYHYSQQQQHGYNRQGVSSSYYGSQKHDYSAESAGYYQQQQAHYHSQDSGYYPPHYQQTAASNGAALLAASSHHADAGYHAQHHYAQQHQHQQSAAAGVYAGGVQKTPADYHPQRHSHKQYASNSSYSGLDAGISMPAPSSSSNAWSGDYYSQQQPHHSSAQVYESQQHPHYRQQGPSSYHHQKHDSHGAVVAEYAGDPRAYYGGSQAMPQQQQPQPQSRSGDPRTHGVPAMGAGAVPSYHHRQATTGGADGHHYSSSSLTNILK